MCACEKVCVLASDKEIGIKTFRQMFPLIFFFVVSIFFLFISEKFNRFNLSLLGTKYPFLFNAVKMIFFLRLWLFVINT